MPAALAPIVTFYDYALQPVPALAWLGVPVSALEVAGALRVALLLRQLRELFHKQHAAKISAATKARNGKGAGKESVALEPIEPRSRVRDFAATLVMVFGGEAVVAPWLGLRPSFFVSSTYPSLFLGAHVLVDLLPAVPEQTLLTELPLTLVHALFRMLLLCNVIPRIVTTHASPAIATSPYTLLLTALVPPAQRRAAHREHARAAPPDAVRLTTPPELLPYGWTATDLWAAPLVTGLYATLTHAQPFFAQLHALLFAFFAPLGLAAAEGGKVAPVDAATARAACAVLLCGLYAARAVRTFGPGLFEQAAPAKARKAAAPSVSVTAESDASLDEKAGNDLAVRATGVEPKSTRKALRTPSSKDGLKKSKAQ
ncbi:hypothetical protein BC834DRAFT_845814 [Gloeopeniophorella convolvens]|nr:hypothetical protein BC834DRAFT_845814 [Gloeopeniophorella convolvens]